MTQPLTRRATLARGVAVEQVGWSRTSKLALIPERSMYSVLSVYGSVALREALARSLTRRGCRVTTAGGSFEALELLRAEPIDAVVTDLNMPDRGGLWLWRQALMLRPELRGHFVLIASEPLPEQPVMAQFKQTERFLLKPLSLETLWREIQEVMDGARPAVSRRRAPAPERVSSPASPSS